MKKVVDWVDKTGGMAEEAALLMTSIKFFFSGM
jgi:hypothetical protein